MSVTTKSWREIVLSLAGVMQAIAQVDKLAKTGFISSSDFETCIKTLFVRSPESAEAVYGSVTYLLRGLESLQALVDDHRNPQNSNLLRYFLGILHLQKKLAGNRTMLDKIGNRLDKANTQLELFGPTHDNLVANIAETYISTISTFSFRLQVAGEQQYLQQTRVSNQIRALLLCAIRSATLWRQVGGRRWHLLVYRKVMRATLLELIAEAKRGLLQN